MTLSIGTFRKNALKTVAPKPAKLGLKLVSKNTLRTNLANAILCLKADVGKLLGSLSQYVLGLQLGQEMKESAFVSLGDIGYDLAILGKLLKIKLPTASKKIKLTGTRTAALLQLDILATDLLLLARTSLFTSPKMKTEKKMVVMPNKGGVKEEREVEVLDIEAETAAENERQVQMRTILSGIVDLYWRLCFDVFQNPPVTVLEAKLSRLQKEYPNIEFEVEKGVKSVA